MRHNRSSDQQRGVVIVLALFIVALVATMAYLMLERLERDTTRTRLILRSTQAALYAQGSVAWAMDQLRNDWEQKKPDQVIDQMPMMLPRSEMNGYTISSTIDDMQGRYNLNNLTNPAAQKDFLRLMLALSPTLNEDQARAIIQATLEGASRTDRIPRRAMVSPSEWKTVKGMTPALYELLSPYVTALPETTLINVQTAPAPVLLTLSESMTLPAALAIVTTRAQSLPVSTQAFLEKDIVINHPIPENKITVSSSYFLVKTDVGIENQHLLIYTLLQRVTKQDKAHIEILWQSIGAW